MAPRTRIKTNSLRRPTQLGAWRKHRGLTLEEACERLIVERHYDITPGTLSRYERGEHPYQQDLMEALAELYGCSPGDLIGRPPGDKEGRQPAILNLWADLSVDEQNRALAALKLLFGRG